MNDRKPEPILAGSTDIRVHERASAMRPSLRSSATQGAHGTHAQTPSTISDHRRETGSPVTAPLRALQEWFAAVMTHPGSVEDGVDAAAKHAGDASVLGTLTPSDIERVVKGDARLDAWARLGVYHEAYQARLIECLADDYPAVQHALGEDDFARICQRYIAAHPSHGPSLNPYGAKMAAFLLEDAASEAAEARALFRFLADLAALEWSLVEVVHAPAAPVLDLARLQALPPQAWGNARLPPAATLRLVRGSYPVNRYFQDFKNDEATTMSPSATDRAPLPAARPSAVAVYRIGFVLWRMDLTPAMADLLAALIGGATLGEALASLDSSVTDAEELAEAERQVMAWFQSWVASGFFERVDVA